MLHREASPFLGMGSRMSCLKSWGACSVRQMPRMTLHSAECTESPPYFSISGKMMQTPGDVLFYYSEVGTLR